jgi:uncharacterized protein (TIGR02118 family)
MYCITVVYPKKDGGKFDFDYYAKKHIPMVSRFLGANHIKSEIRKGIASPDGSPASFVCVASIWIKSIEEFQTTLAQHGPKIMGDIPNYTNIQPILQVDEVVE